MIVVNKNFYEIFIHFQLIKGYFDDTDVSTDKPVTVGLDWTGLDWIGLDWSHDGLFQTKHSLTG